MKEKDTGKIAVSPPCDQWTDHDRPLKTGRT